MAIIREVHTNLYSKSAANIIKAALTACGNFCTNTSHQSRRTAKHAQINHNPNGELIIAWNDNNVSYWRLASAVKNKNDVNARQWIAWQIKDVVQHPHRSIEWKRNNTAKAETLSHFAECDVTVQEAYCLYELLLDRKTVNKHFPDEMLADFRGTENDPFKTEMEVQRRNEVKLITDEYRKKLDNANYNSYNSELYMKMQEEINAIRTRYRDESTRLMNELITERDAKLKELNDQFDDLSAL